MKILCIKDKKITGGEEVIAEFNSIYEEFSPEWDIHEEDMSDLPFSYYYGDKMGIDKKYLKERAKATWQRYARKYDYILFWVHDENYIPAHTSSRIWGWSTPVSTRYDVIQCRYDPNNTANSVGTLHHEIMHTHDSFIYRMLGKWISPVLEVKDYDDCCVHGKCDGYEYIRHKENLDVIETISPLLKEAYQKRRGRHQEHISVLEKLVEAYQGLVAILTKKDHEENS